MKRKARYSWLVAIVGICCLAACSDRSAYERMARRELNRNVRYDSLFLGISFKMNRKDFFGHCWDLNKQGLLGQGPGNLSAEHLVDSTQMRYNTYMRFYPKFQNDEIFLMPVEFIYTNWAPWNKSTSSDSLLPDVKQLLTKWYPGNEFIDIELPNEEKAWVKVDGNRRMEIFKKDINTVKVVIRDLTVKEEKEKEAKSDNA